MSSYYNIPEEYSEDSYIFNPDTWTSPADVSSGNTTITAGDGSGGSGNYVSKTGDTMTGGLAVPNLTTATIYFQDATEQSSAADINKINTSAEKTTAFTYDASLNITDIGNYTCSNYDVLSLSGITGSLQTRMNTLETKTTNQSLASSTQTNFSQNVYIQTLTAGNFNSSHLSGTTSNIQTQLNQISGGTGYYFYTSSATVNPPSNAKMAIVTCVGGGGGGGSAPQRNDDAPRTLRGGSAGGGGGWSQSKIILNGFNQMEIIVGAGGTSGYWGWYTYADGKSIKAYTNSLAEYTPPTALSTLQVLPGGTGGISQVKYKSFCMCYAGGGTSGLTDSDYSGSGNKSGGIGGLGDINGSQGGYGCGSSQSSCSGGDAPDITDKGIGGGGGGGMVSAITVGNGGDGSGFKPSNYPDGSQGRGAGGYKFVEDGDGQTTNAYILGYATAGPGGGASMNNGKFGGDGGDGIYGAGGGGAGAGYVSAGATVDGYRANVFGGVGGNGYVSIEYLF